MVWMEKNTVPLRQEFVHLAGQDDANVRALCCHFGISPKTGYKWLSRFKAADGDASAPHDRSRRPLSSPTRSGNATEQAVLALRQQHPAWGGRKIAARLHELGQATVAPSTVTHILHRHGLIAAGARKAAQAWQRFEHEAPNRLWQIDFKGDSPPWPGAAMRSRCWMTIHASTCCSVPRLAPVQRVRASGSRGCFAATACRCA